MCICGKPDCEVPYGLCHCGCGEVTPIVRFTDRPKQRIAGLPSRFIIGHSNREARIVIQQPSDPTIRHIALTRGQITVVDAGDFAWLGKWAWFALGDLEDGCYAARHRAIADGAGPGIILMHRVILGLDGSDEIEEGDHRDGNRLNNRRGNLRQGPHANNQMNRGMAQNNTSGCAGVSFHKRRQRYQVRIGVGGKEMYLGYADTLAAAEAIRKEAEQRYYGDWARKS